MIIKARNYEETIRGIKFIKAWNREKIEKFLKENNMYEFDDAFLLMDISGNLNIKIWNVDEPKIIDIAF